MAIPVAQQALDGLSEGSARTASAVEGARGDEADPDVDPLALPMDLYAVLRELEEDCAAAQRELGVLRNKFTVHHDTHRTNWKCLFHYCRPIQRCLQTYALGDTATISLAVFVGFLTQELLVILSCSQPLELQGGSCGRASALFVVAVLAVLIALLCSEMLKLARVCFGTAGHMRCRSVMFAAVMDELPQKGCGEDLAGQYWRHREWRVGLIDWWFTWGFSICTVVLGLLIMAIAAIVYGMDLRANMSSFGSSLGIYAGSFVLGACVWALTTVVALILSDGMVALGGTAKEQFLEVVRRRVRTHEIEPGEMRSEGERIKK